MNGSTSSVSGFLAKCNDESRRRKVEQLSDTILRNESKIEVTRNQIIEEENTISTLLGTDFMER